MTSVLVPLELQSYWYCGDSEGDPSSLPRSAAVRRGSRYFDAKSTMDQPRWTAVDLVLDRAFRTVIGRAQLQSLPFADSPLTGKGSRLSVMPITRTQWSDVVQIAAHRGSEIHPIRWRPTRSPAPLTRTSFGVALATD